MYKGRNMNKLDKLLEWIEKNYTIVQYLGKREQREFVYKDELINKIKELKGGK